MKASTLTTLGILQKEYPNNKVIYFKGNFYVI